MSIFKNVRNFFYAITHANQLVAAQQELAEKKPFISLVEQDISQVTEFDTFDMDDRREMNEKDLQTIAAQMRVYINCGMEANDALRRAYKEHTKRRGVNEIAENIRADLDKGYSFAHVRLVWRIYPAPPPDWVEEALSLVEAECKSYQKDTHEELANQPVIIRPENMNADQPVGEIKYLGFRKEVIHSVLYTDASLFVQQVMEDNHRGIPMNITVFSDPENGSHIDTSWCAEMDPPLHSFRIIPY